MKYILTDKNYGRKAFTDSYGDAYDKDEAYDVLDGLEE